MSVHEPWTTFAVLFVMLAGCVGSAACYGLQGDWRRAIYWLAVATITAVMTCEGELA